MLHYVLPSGQLKTKVESMKKKLQSNQLLDLSLETTWEFKKWLDRRRWIIQHTFKPFTIIFRSNLPEIVVFFPIARDVRIDFLCFILKLYFSGTRSLFSSGIVLPSGHYYLETWTLAYLGQYFRSRLAPRESESTHLFCHSDGLLGFAEVQQRYLFGVLLVDRLDLFIFRRLSGVKPQWKWSGA